MKLTYFGTAAAEGFPALFCNCECCKQARMLGGKNLRTRSQSLINDDLLIDFPADTYTHFLQNGIEGDKIPYLLITHAHPDHLYPIDLLRKVAPYAHGMRTPTLRLFCSAGTAAYLQPQSPNVEVTILTPYQTIEFGSYRVTALPARHMPGGEPLFYVIEEGDKAILYAHDTGYFYEEVFDFPAEKKFVFDFVSLDCTYVDLPCSDEGAHMGFDQIGRLLDRLYAMGAITDKTVKYVNHYSHNGNPLHVRVEALAAQYGCFAAYDGCRVIV